MVISKHYLRKLVVPLLALFIVYSITRLLFTSDHSNNSKISLADAERIHSDDRHHSHSAKQSDGRSKNTVEHDDYSILNCMQVFASERDYSNLVKCITSINNMKQLSSSLLTETKTRPLTIIALIVHNRPLYFRKVLESLSRVIGIENSILLISHDGYFPEMHQLASQVKFCPVKQIYHPYSSSLPQQALATFSPLENVDLLSPVKVETTSNSVTMADQILNQVKITLEQDLQNSFLIDEHFSQARAKHHYWWLWNYLFRYNANIRSLPIKMDFDVIFLEEDHYVAPDLLDTFARLQKLKEKCEDCFGINLGHQLPDMEKENLLSVYNKFQLSVLSNIGMSFKKSAFLKYLHAKSEKFCSFNDYNWDLTMYRMEQDGDIPEKSLAASLSRVYHIGKCGMHISDTDCDPLESIESIENEIFEKLRNSKLSKAKEVVSTEWLEEPFSKRGPIGGVEGWTSGKLWGKELDQKGNKLADHIWESSINYDHCVWISKSDLTSTK